MRRRMFLRAGAALIVSLIAQGTAGIRESAAEEERETFEVARTDDEWRSFLSEDQYLVLRKEVTEPPFTNKYYKHNARGSYLCAGCELPLFSSTDKYSSKSGWPSFSKPIGGDAVRAKTDHKLFFPRTEVHCRRCGGHLGHIFKDGPPPDWLRYCINSAALTFVPA